MTFLNELLHYAEMYENRLISKEELQDYAARVYKQTKYLRYPEYILASHFTLPIIHADETGRFDETVALLSDARRGKKALIYDNNMICMRLGDMDDETLHMIDATEQYIMRYSAEEKPPVSDEFQRMAEGYRSKAADDLPHQLVLMLITLTAELTKSIHNSIGIEAEDLSTFILQKAEKLLNDLKEEHYFCLSLKYYQGSFTYVIL